VDGEANRVEQPAQYKTTLFDRHGAAAADIVRAWGFALLVFGVTMGAISFSMAAGGSTPMLWQWLEALFISAALGAVTGFSGLLIGRAAGKGWKHLMVDGSTTPYEEQYSHEQSLVMRGQLDDALASFEAILQGNPDAVKPRVRAAELYAREKGNNVRAAQLLVEIQRIPSTSVGDYVYATHRLVDLYTGPLNEPGRAMVELRRLIERLPGSAAADQAREALATLKARHSRG
jgi:hypothetical protein